MNNAYNGIWDLIAYTKTKGTIVTHVQYHKNGLEYFYVRSVSDSSGESETIFFFNDSPTEKLWHKLDKKYNKSSIAI